MLVEKLINVLTCSNVFLCVFVLSVCHVHNTVTVYNLCPLLKIATMMLISFNKWVVVS